MATQLDKLRAENLRLQDELRRVLEREEKWKKLLVESVRELRFLIRLTETWVYGLVFRRAGVFWPEGKCNAPAYVSSKRWLKNYDDNYD